MNNNDSHIHVNDTRTRVYKNPVFPKNSRQYRELVRITMLKLRYRDQYAELNHGGELKLRQNDRILPIRPVQLAIPCK